MQSLVLRYALVLCLGCAAGAALAQEADPAAVARGAYIAQLGDCTSCHTWQGHPPMSGGYALHSPFGIIYAQNITPDPQTGIGTWSFADFDRAVRQGVDKRGRHLYPAMPYPSFSLMSDADMHDLYAYFMHGVAPVRYTPPETHLGFPFNQRWGAAIWNVFFLSGKRFAPDPAHGALWNRGAYLVRGPGHCGGCHTPRGFAYQETGSKENHRYFLTGGLLDQWYAPSLRGDDADGLGRWSEDDIASFLATGHGAGTVAFGNMAQVVENSGQYMTDEDRQAIAHYLKSLSAAGKPAVFHPDNKDEINGHEAPGAGIHANFCARCHLENGSGKPPRVPKLAGSATVLADDPTSLIRIVLEGGKSPQTQDGPKPADMPPFALKLDDLEIAQVVSYIRASWGNHAPPVTRRSVASLRHALKKP